MVPLWRAHVAETLADSEAEKIRQDVEGLLDERIDTGDRDLVGRIGQTVSDAVARRIRESVLPACLRWFREQGHCWPEFSEVRALNEIRGAFSAVAPIVPGLPAPLSMVRHEAWALPAGFGAALGGIALIPLMVVLPLQLDVVAIFAGGIFGAAGLVWLIGWVASRPKIVAGLETGMKLGGIAGLPIVFWRGLRGRSFGLVRTAALALGAWLVLVTVRPRILLPSRAEVLANLDGPIRALLAHEADIALAMCWAHNSCLARPEAPSAPALGGPIFRAIRDARCAVRGPSATRDDLVDSVEALLQRLDDDEYQWVEVDRGTPYSESIEPYFQKFGKIDIGQPVEMHQPALVRHDVVVEPGMLRRVRT